jgi:uncharacterized protein
MKSQISLLALMCMMVSLSQPAWSMEQEENQVHRSTAPTPMAMPTEVEPLETEESRLKDAAEQGDMESQWRIAAEQGCSQAQFSLACAYKRGDEQKEPQWDKAIYWFTKAGEQGHVEAQFQLASIYKDGDGNESHTPELNKAIPWLQSAADLGYRHAQSIIGSYYERGEWVPQNIATALNYYTLAAKQNDKFAKYKIGMVYKNGLADAGKPDWGKAVAWFNLAALQGCSYSQYELGLCYYRWNEGVPHDFAKAKQLFKLAAAQGNQHAQHALQLMNEQ